MADAFRPSPSVVPRSVWEPPTHNVNVYAQDPAYDAMDNAFLEKRGIAPVGEHGAGGFSLIDDESVVFTCCVSVPVWQIMADIGRPVMIIARGKPEYVSDDNGG